MTAFFTINFAIVDLYTSASARGERPTFRLLSFDFGARDERSYYEAMSLQITVLKSQSKVPYVPY